MNHGENIRKELEEIAPEIPWDIPKPDFSIPEGYFPRFTRSVLDKIHAETEEGLIIGKAGKKNVYTVPAGYFEALPNEVLQKVQPSHRVISLPRRRKYRNGWAVAAAMAVFVALAGILSIPRHGGAPSFDAQLAGISEQAIEQYLNTHISDLSSEELSDYINTSDIQNTLQSDFSTQDIEEYLNNNTYIPDSN